MTNESQAPQVPWWVSYWTGPTTTRSTLRREAGLFFLMAVVSLCVGTISVLWQPPWGGVIVRPAVLVLFPVVFAVAGTWQLIAAGWIDRHKAWDRISTGAEPEADTENNSLWTRSLPSGVFLMAIGGGAGALTGWVWESEIGLGVGFIFGALSGFVLAIALSGYREGVGPKL